MPVEDKIAAVRGYLLDEFPGSKVTDRNDADRGARVFTVSSAGKSHLAIISGEFLQAHDAAGIAGILKDFTLAEHLRELGTIPILVTNGGLELEHM